MNKNPIPTLIICAVIFILFIPIALGISSLFKGEKKYYTATFIDSGSTYLIQENIPKKSYVSEPVDPVKDGYKFIGWFEDDDLYDFTTPVTRDIYLQAKWISDKPIDDDDVVVPTPSPTPTPTPTATPTPTPSATPKSTSKPRATSTPKSSVTPTVNKYTITVNNGTINGGANTGVFNEGTVITISASVPASSTSNWIGRDSCSGIGDNGNYKYQEQTSYSFKGWTDGNTSVTRTVKVTGNATYTAEFNKSLTKVNAQTCGCTTTPNYGYPKGILFDFSNTSGSGSGANGYINGPASADVKCSKKCNIVDTNPNVYLPYHISWNFPSTNTKWTVSYSTTTGIATLYGGKDVDNRRTVTLNVTYSENEVDYPLTFQTHEYSSSGLYVGYGFNCNLANPTQPGCYYKSISNSQSGKKKIESLTVQLPKVINSKTTTCRFR